MQNDIKQDIIQIRNELESLNDKIDNVINILNNFTIMLLESDEDEDMDLYDSDDSWVPNDDSEDWGNYEDES
jgi:hypothetical protein